MDSGAFPFDPDLLILLSIGAYLILSACLALSPSEVGIILLSQVPRYFPLTYLTLPPYHLPPATYHLPPTTYLHPTQSRHHTCSCRRRHRDQELGKELQSERTSASTMHPLNMDVERGAASRLATTGRAWNFDARCSRVVHM